MTKEQIDFHIRAGNILPGDEKTDEQEVAEAAAKAARKQLEADVLRIAFPHADPAKVGVIEGAGHPGKPVKIRMHHGAVVEVDHKHALQVILRRDAELA